jgi:PhnB protein
MPDNMINSPITSPYLFFEGRCEEAVEFYKTAVGAEVAMMMRYKEAPEPPPGPMPAGYENKIIHAQLKIGPTLLMMSDGRCLGKATFQGFAISLMVPTEAEAKKRFAALSEGGQVQAPMSKTFFSPSFGMVIDRFGVFWMVLVPRQM